MQEKKEKFHVMAGFECDMIVENNKNQAIAYWFSVHYSHITRDKQLIKTAKRRMSVHHTYEENNKIYLVP